MAMVVDFTFVLRNVETDFDDGGDVCWFGEICHQISLSFF